MLKNASGRAIRSSMLFTLRHNRPESRVRARVQGQGQGQDQGQDQGQGQGSELGARVQGQGQGQGQGHSPGQLSTLIRPESQVAQTALNHPELPQK